MPLFDNLLLWNDTTPRSGEVNMAIDELLLKQIDQLPILRFYSWDRPSISFGYFEALNSAKSSFPSKGQDLHYVRRWTGGGIVDHRIDLTYTLIIPRSHPLSSLRGAESYHHIHQAVAEALNLQGIKCALTQTSSSSNLNPSTCFSNPVPHDIIMTDGTKLAGAGQKRSRSGLLHQGSVINIHDIQQWQNDFPHALSHNLQIWHPAKHLIHQAHKLSTTKYSAIDWLEKR